MITQIDRVAVIFRMFNSNGGMILEEHRVIALSSLLAITYAYSITKPDACVRMTVDIAFPKV